MPKCEDGRYLITEPWERLIVEGMERLSLADQHACVRFALRLLNNDKKVLRLLAMEEAGQITARQLIRMM